MTDQTAEQRPANGRAERQRIGEADDPGGRGEWFHASRAGGERKLIDQLYIRASRQRHMLISRQKREPGAPPAPPGGAGAVNWTPIGPSVVEHGQASGNPPVSGRITSIVPGPTGTRAYAGTANGGVWLTGDSGANWSPLDDYAVSPSLTSAIEADSLAVGAVAVQFGATAATDLVYVGTGEANNNFDAY